LLFYTVSVLKKKHYYKNYTTSFRMHAYSRCARISTITFPYEIYKNKQIHFIPLDLLYLSFIPFLESSVQVFSPPKLILLYIIYIYISFVSHTRSKSRASLSPLTKI